MPSSVNSSKFLNSKLTLLLLVFCSVFLFYFIAEFSLRVLAKEERIIDKSWWERYVKRNKLNYRDIEHKTNKPSNIFRILILGDSQTVGHGIDNLEDTWPKKLESLLNSNLQKKRFEIINSAYQGWNTDTQLYELFKNGFSFNPDLVLLGFYPNDTPPPVHLNCNPDDKDFLSLVHKYFPFTNESRLFNFLNFRINRLHEKLKLKPTYSECLNLIYKSRGWEMERVYLDTMAKGIRLKGSHFMAAVIPVFFQLGENYPFQKIHKKVIDWFKKNGTPALDLWEQGFYGMDASQLIASPQDRHLNSKAAEIIAQTIYKKLKPLKRLNKLNVYQKALNFDDLISDSNWIKKLDQSFEVLEHLNQKKHYDISDENSKKRLAVWKTKNQIYLERSSFNQDSSTLKQTQKTTLNVDGDLIKNEILWYPSSSKTLIFWNSLTLNENKNSLLKFGEINAQNQKVEKKALEFTYRTKKFGKVLKLEVLKNIFFADPKSLEVAFSEIAKPKLKIKGSEIFDTVKKIIGLNTNLFFDLKNKGYTLRDNFSKLPQQEQILVYKEMECTKYLFTLSKLGHSRYIDSLIKDILIHNPVPVLLRSVERYYFVTKRSKELNQFYQANPTLPNRFRI
jgi:lysophospholipase L1-like esterase